jgi:hypothetical protein
MKMITRPAAWMVRSALVLMLLTPILWCQAENAVPVERTFAYPPDIVKSALARVSGSGGKLPMVDGFVLAAVPEMDRYERPYYQYRVQLMPGEGNKSIVKVEARISAWYADSDPAHAQYRSLPSNGRLENDFLDRLQEALTPGSSKAGGTAPKSIPATVLPGSNLAHPGSVSSPESKPSVPAVKPQGMPSTPQEQLDAVLAQRQEVREKTAAAKAQLDALKAAEQNAGEVAKLASVKHSGVGVMSRQNFGGPVLFRAQAEDEFEVQSLDSSWAQVRLADGTTGYIQADELTLPAGMLPKTSTGTQVAASQSAKPTDPELDFWVSREDVNTFSGDWARLKGKKVLFVYAQPRGLLSDMAGDDAKLAYAKRVFMSRFKSVNPAATAVEGVVVVFMGNRGGVAAATLADIQQWVEGGLGDEAFVNRCSLDPLAEFKRIHMK